MKRNQWMAISLVAVLALGLGIGCSDSDSDSGGSADSYAGTWTGTVCGRGLTMQLRQNGSTLTGSYTLSDPTFSENISGTLSSLTPPATATLKSTSGRDFEFRMTFPSYNAASGGYYKEGAKVCNVTANK